MIHIEGLTFEEMARRTGQTTVAAKHHYYRGMAKLREFITAKANHMEPVKEARVMKSWEIAHARPQSI